MTVVCCPCGARLDPTVFHDDSVDGSQLCESCCPTCTPTSGEEPMTTEITAEPTVVERAAEVLANVEETPRGRRPVSDTFDLADRLAILHQHTSPSGKLRTCTCPVCPDLRAAVAELRRLTAENARLRDERRHLTGNNAVDMAITFAYELGQADAQADD